MSLTSELRNTKSPTYRFMRERLPNVAALRPEWRAQVAAARMIRPLEDPGDHRGTIGSAIDYRLRYYFPQPANPTVPHPLHGHPFPIALSGSTYLWADSAEQRPRPRKFWRELSQAFFAEQEKLVATLLPGERLEREAENDLCRRCVVLAMFEQLFRAGPEIHSPLWEVRSTATVGDLLASVPIAWVDDLRAMSWAFIRNHGELATTRAVLNPTFDGSLDVGGADGDLIAHGCYIDFKTLMRPEELRLQHVYQVVGYALLDYSDAYRVRSVGIYLARHALLIRWRLTELLPTLAGRRVSLRALRRDFSQLFEPSPATRRRVASVPRWTTSKRPAPVSTR